MVAAYSYFSPEEYLAFESDSKTRHEYRQGLVYAMAGSSEDHITISANLYMALRQALKGSPCRAHLIDTRVQLERSTSFYYPDVFVTCDSRDRADKYTKRYPSLIAEVLSPSTEKFDRGEKFSDYQQIDSLQDYLLISQDKMQVEVRRKTEAGIWETMIYGPGDRIEFSRWGLSLPIEDLYEDVELLPPEARSSEA
ncbi:MAG TPA: Uma2 family endonuclease [Coleofasciculaceae cyanobacterium]